MPSVASEYRTGWRRAGAALADSILLLPAGVLLAQFAYGSGEYWLRTTAYIVAACLPYAYSVLMHSLRGQTVGKLLFRVVVRDATLQTIRFSNAVRRDLVPLVATIAMLVAQYTVKEPLLVDQLSTVMSSFFLLWMALELLTMLFSDRRRALHDVIGGTVVVRVA
jgi:uncharacterized RDD family membrane protein YckC